MLHHDEAARGLAPQPGLQALGGSTTRGSGKTRSATSASTSSTGKGWRARGGKTGGSSKGWGNTTPSRANGRRTENQRAIEAIADQRIASSGGRSSKRPTGGLRNTENQRAIETIAERRIDSATGKGSRTSKTGRR